MEPSIYVTVAKTVFAFAAMLLAGGIATGISLRHQRNHDKK